MSQKHHGNQKETHVSHKLHFDIFLHKGCSCKNCRRRSCSPRIICKISTICFLQRPETSMWKGQITEAASRLGSQRFLKWNHISGVMKWRGGCFYRIVDNRYSLWCIYHEMLCNFYGRITIVLDIHRIHHPNKNRPCFFPFSPGKLQKKSAVRMFLSSRNLPIFSATNRWKKRYISQPCGQSEGHTQVATI